MNATKLTLLLIGLHCSVVFAEEQASNSLRDSASARSDVSVQNVEGKSMSWEGKWNNRKFGTNGPLVCTATVKDDKTWEAKFTGTGIGKPFEYDATFSATKKGDQILLQGMSVIDGDAYRWTGTVRGQTMIGRYRSASGNNGEFQLKVPNAK